MDNLVKFLLIILVLFVLYAIFKNCYKCSNKSNSTNTDQSNINDRISNIGDQLANTGNQYIAPLKNSYQNFVKYLKQKNPFSQQNNANEQEQQEQEQEQEQELNQEEIDQSPLLRMGQNFSLEERLMRGNNQNVDIDVNVDVLDKENPIQGYNLPLQAVSIDDYSIYSS